MAGRWIKLRERAEERRTPVERSCLELLVILLALVVGELVWIVCFTWLALWLRGAL